MTRAFLLILALLATEAEALDSAVAVDGDTIVIGAERIRIQNMDAPELLHPGCASEYAAAVRARDRLAELIAGGVDLARSGRDRFGRTLAIVRDSAGRDVALVLIAEGLARPWDGRRHPWCSE